MYKIAELVNYMYAKTKLNYYLIVAIAICVSFSETAKADNVDDYIRSQLAEHHVTGVAAAIIKDGRIIKIKGYGLASVEFDVPVTTDTVFEIGSVSKQMTAAGIMLLVEDGKIDLDERIVKYLPG